MNKTIIIIALTAMLMLGILAPLVFAEDAVTDATPNLISAASDTTITTEADASLATDSDASAGKVAWKQLALWLTFKEDKKVQGELELARLRLIQAKIAAKNNNTAAIEKALDAHEKLINDVEKRIENIKKTEKNAEKLKGLDRAIEVHNARINKLNDLLANSNLTADERDKIEARLAQTENVTAHLSGVQAKIYTNIAEKAAAFKVEADSKNMTVAELLKERRADKD